MKLSIVTVLAMAGTAYGVHNTEDFPLPVQTYFLPLPEWHIKDDTFGKIDPATSGNIHSTTSIAIGVFNTVIWYDHSEDGFESDVTNPSSSTTQIWGDGDISNGCAPGHPCTTNAEDALNPGDVIVLENMVDPTRTRNANSLLFDGGDRIQSSKAVALTKAEYPESPGSELAGAVEILDTTQWGKNFECPIGENWYADNSVSPFEYTGLYVMAGEDSTSVTISTKGETFSYTLQTGESVNVRANIGAAVTADKDVQVHVLAGDISSDYEMRWFSLLPTEKWASEYLSPVGNAGEPRGLIYNPHSTSLTVSYKQGAAGAVTTVTVPAGWMEQTGVLNGGMGTHFSSDRNFVVFEIVDTTGDGHIFDWGLPIMPVRDLSPQVLVGWGYGCQSNDCSATGLDPAHDTTQDHTASRSVIWVAPVEACTFTIDYDGNGSIDHTEAAAQYESLTFSDPNDNDMTGAMIHCKKSDGTPVNFAAAWGQNPSLSFDNDFKALDMGTLVPPYHCELTETYACLTVDNNQDGAMNAGETCSVLTRTVNNCMDTVSDFITTESCKDPALYTETDICLHVSKSAGIRGDPHVKRWDRKEFEWHGECDLMMAKATDIEVHARTKIHDWWSSVEAAVVESHGVTVEVGLDYLLINGQQKYDDELPFDSVDLHQSLSVAVDVDGVKTYTYKITKYSTVTFKIAEGLMAIDIDGAKPDFDDVIGVVGDFNLGKAFTRAGSRFTALDGFIEEWQVGAADQSLFQTAGSATCVMPTVAKPWRRLGAQKALEKEAQEACAGKENVDGCVSDVIMSGIVGIAKLW